MKNHVSIHNGNPGGQPWQPKVEKTASGFRVQVAVTDPLVTQYLDALPEGARLGSSESALDIGFRVLISQRGEATVVHLTDQMEAAAKAVTDLLGAAGEGHARQLNLIAATYLGEDGALTKAMNAVAKDFVGLLDPNASPAVRALREAILSDLMKPSQALIKEIKDVMNVNDDASAVGILDKKISALTTALAALTAKVEDAMTLAVAKRRDPAHAGATLEDFFFAVVSPMAQSCSDMLEDTRIVAGAIEGCKTGDYTTTLDSRVVNGQGARIASEAKNRVSVTLSKLAAELDVAMRNRHAVVGFGILTNPRASTEPTITIHGGNKVIVCLPGFGTSACDPEIVEVFLRAGYQTARTLAILLTVNEPQEVAVDLAALQGSCDQISAIVKSYPTLQAAHTRIHTAVKNAEELTDDMKSALLTALDKLVRTVEAMARASKEKTPE